MSRRLHPGVQDDDLRVPRLHAVVLEELAHAWDYRLEAEGSPYSSAGEKWLSVYLDAVTRTRRVGGGP